MAGIEIQLLGRFSVRRSGEEIPPTSFGGRLVRTLVRLLVTRRGTFVPNDVLADALWPERMPADPSANLRVLVQRARAGLGDASLIVTGPGGYSFAAGKRCVVDTEVFLAAVNAGQKQLAAGRPAAALREFLSALEGWRGEPLAEDAYEEWAREPRAALHRAHLIALEAGAEAALALRDADQAVVMAEQAVTREPLREPCALLLARAFAASGDKAAALRTIGLLRRRLAEERLEPSPVAVALETQLEQGETVAESPRRRSVTSVRAGFEGLVFVGRDTELHTVLTVAQGPEPGVVLVAGAAGTGKSRLLSEAAERSEVPVVAARAFLPDRDEPWSLGRSLLREALALDLDSARTMPDRAAQALADVLPELEELRSIGSTTVDPESRRALALEAAATMMAAAAAKGAMVIVDDLQWTDATSLAVLGLIARRVPQAGIVLAYRPEDVEAETSVRTFIDELHAVRQQVVEVTVGPLSPETISLLVADDQMAEVMAKNTDATPLALAEAIRSLSGEGIIEPDARGRWASREPGAVQRARAVAHSGQRRAIAQRAARQPKDRKQLLSLIALVGREAPARVFARAIEAPEARILDDLDALARAGLVRLGEAGWAVAHDLIGEVLAESLDRTERGRLHLLLARAIETEGGDAAEVAHHLAGAGDRDSAAVAFCEAARTRLMNFAGDEARHLADTGLALVSQPGTRTALLRTRAEARALRGDLTGARDDFRAALVAIGRGPERSHTLTRVAELTSALDDYDRADELIEVALAEAGDDKAARAEALMQSAFFHANRNQVREAEERAAEALTLFEEAGDSTGVASALDLRGLAEFVRGRVVEAADLCDRAARLYRDCGRLLKVGSTRGFRGWMLLMNDRAEEALREADEAIDLERSLGQREGETLGLFLRAETLCALGRPEEARVDAAAGLALSRALGNREFTSWCLRAAALCSRELGDFPRAEAELREAMEEGRGIPLVERLSAAQLASLLVERGDLDAAERYARESEGEGIFQFESSLVLAEVALLRGEADAEQLAADALALTEEGGYLLSTTRKRLEARVMPTKRRPSRVRRRQRRTFMFTDIVDSTSLVETLGDDSWEHLLRWHDKTLRSLFASHRGEEAKHVGDGFFVAFEQADDAVRCAIDIQRVLARHRAEHGFAPEVRIGLHEAEATREGKDYKGKGVHEAARIGALAQGGEILASHGVVRSTSDRVRSPRSVTLKGLSKPMEVESIDWSR